MKQSPMPPRTKPMPRYKPLRQVSPNRAQAAVKPARPRDTGPDTATRNLIKRRDKGCCVVCGVVVPADNSIHHRRNRGNGGSSDPAINAPSNLLLVCGSGTTLCHGDLTDNRDRPEALAAGWVVSLNGKQRPAAVPVEHAIHGLVLLDDDGSFTTVGSAAA